MATHIELIPDKTVLYQFATFMGALVVLNWGVFRPALKLIQARRKATEGNEGTTHDLTQKISALEQRIEASLSQAQHEGQDIIQKLRQEAEASAQATLQRAREQFDRDLQKMRQDLETQAQSIEQELTQQVGVLSKRLTERLLERPVH